jgi:hypothetical protein
VTPQRFPFRIDGRARPILRIFGVGSVDDAYVLVDDVDFTAHFGRFEVTTPLTNIVSWRIEGPWHSITAIGVRRSVRHADLTFGGTARGGVRVDFRAPVRVGPMHPPALYVTVADCEGLGAALTERGVPGSDARRGVSDD